MAKPTRDNPKPLPQLVKEGKAQRKIYDKAKAELIDIGKALRDYPAHGLTKQQQSDRAKIVHGIPKNHPPKPKARTTTKPKATTKKRTTRAKKKSSS